MPHPDLKQPTPDWHLPETIQPPGHTMCLVSHTGSVGAKGEGPLIRSKTGRCCPSSCTLFKNWTTYTIGQWILKGNDAHKLWARHAGTAYLRSQQRLMNPAKLGPAPQCMPTAYNSSLTFTPICQSTSSKWAKARKIHTSNQKSCTPPKTLRLPMPRLDV